MIYFKYFCWLLIGCLLLSSSLFANNLTLSCPHKDISFKVELAEEPQDQEKGLMFRKHLAENVVHRIDLNANTLHVSRSEYIKEAILEMNFKIQERMHKERLMAASQRVRKESMKINAEFSAIENDPEA